MGVADTDRAGTGVHRLYEKTEVQIAALLVPIANLGIPIGELRKFANYLRPYLETLSQIDPSLWQEAKENGGFKHPHTRLWHALWRSNLGIGENYLLLMHGAENVVAEAYTDEFGPISIKPLQDIPVETRKSNPANAMIILDLTAHLSKLAK